MRLNFLFFAHSWNLHHCLLRAGNGSVFSRHCAGLDQLSLDAREIANLAAAYGRDFSFELIAEVAQQHEETLADCLDELCHRNILTKKKGCYDFSHDRLREVSYHCIGSARRRIWHRRIAEAMEKLHQGRLDSVKTEVAAHFSRAHLHQQAIAYYQQAAAFPRGLETIHPSSTSGRIKIQKLLLKTK